MKNQTLVFGPGFYALVLPKKVRNVSTIVFFILSHGGFMSNGIKFGVEKLRKGQKIDFDLMRQNGWIILENKMAGPHEKKCISLLTHNRDFSGGHMSLIEGITFSNREEFFQLLESALKTMLDLQKKFSAGLLRGYDEVKFEKQLQP